VLPLSTAQWDITDPSAGRGIVESGDVVVNCAAYTAVDAAEADPEGAYTVNAVGAGNVARTCARAGARLIHLSTDYVFSGHFDGPARPYDIDDSPEPLSVYGRSKLAGERAVRAELPDAHVVRTSWVYTGDGGDFVAAIARRVDGDGPIDVVVDETGSPTYVGDLVGALLQIAGRARNARQFDIGNAITASLMTRHRLGAAQYAPIRVVLYENDAGHAVFEYDRPSSLFGQFDDEQVNVVARGLDAALARALLGAAS